MKQFHDPFPETPEGFHLRVENTLMRMEEEEMKYVRRYSMKVIAVAAAVILTLAVTAVAVVEGNHILRNTINDRQGTVNTADYVQDVQAAAEQDGFRLSIDEYVSYARTLDLSCTLTVPDDGGTYLCALYTPEFNGAKIDMEHGGYYDMPASDAARMYVLGGEYATCFSDVLDGLYAPDSSDGQTGDTVKLKVAILRTDLPVRFWSDHEEQRALMEHISYTNKNGETTDAWPTYRESGVLYACDVRQEQDMPPQVDMLEYHQVLENVIPDMATHPGGYISPSMEQLEAAGMGKLAAVLEVSLPIEWLDAPRFEG